MLSLGLLVLSLGSVWGVGVSRPFLLRSALCFFSLMRLFSPPALHAPLVQTGLKVIFLRDFLQITENQEHLVPSPKLKF